MKPPLRRGGLCHMLNKHVAKDSPGAAGLAI